MFDELQEMKKSGEVDDEGYARLKKEAQSRYRGLHPEPETLSPKSHFRKLEPLTLSFLSEPFLIIEVPLHQCRP